MPNREIALSNWAIKQVNNSDIRISPLCGDASFRRYFRVQSGDTTFILMDAPPPFEPLAPFLRTAVILRSCTMRVPEVYAADEQMGFALLEDFGDQLLLNAATTSNPDPLYRAAIQQLLCIQSWQQNSSPAFPFFDRDFMLQEMMLCIEWFIKGYAKYLLNRIEQTMLLNTFEQIAEQIRQQPQVLIHRDYHSRNIMVIQQEDPVMLGIIDFQDAMTGPYSYDMVSLGKDCYLEWPRDTQVEWLRCYYDHSIYNTQRDFNTFLCDYDYCGLQRHLKILGVFSRLHLRDGKNSYLGNIPLTLKHLLNCLERTGWFPEMFHFFQRISVS